MKRAPEELDGASVVRWCVLPDGESWTQACRHFVAGQLQGPAAALAVCRYGESSDYYLFGCDEEWNVITDTCHETLEEALRQAEFEYRGASKAWNFA